MREPNAVYREIAREPWYRSLAAHLRASLQESPHVSVTASPDMSALDGLIRHRYPWQALAGHMRDFLGPRPKPFEATAPPVEVLDIWSPARRRGPLSMAALAHLVAAVALLGGLWPRPEPMIPVTATAVPLYLPVDLFELPPEDTVSGGGGGGGQAALTAPSLGEAPRADDRQFVPPSAEPPAHPNPILVMEPTIVAPQLAELLTLMPDLVGDPLEGIPGPPSSGPGTGGGIGTGSGTGVGAGDGAGLGPGTGGGFGGGVFTVGAGVTRPSILTRVDPIYSEEARRAQYEGTVVLEAIVRADGTVDILRVVRNPGFGLEQQAIDALSQWKFTPAMRSGVPVDVAMNIEIHFNLH